MNAASVMLQANELGIRLGLKDGALTIKAPKGALTAEFKAQLAACKQEIMAILQQQSAAFGAESANGAQPDAILAPREKSQVQLPLSYAQQRLWFVDKLNQGSSEYNIPIALKVEGRFDLAKAEQALIQIIERHEVLRTVFIELEQGPVQVILQQFSFQLTQVDLTELDVQSQQQKVAALVAKDRSMAFDLSQDLMLRAGFVLLAQSDDKLEGVLLFNLHHIAADAQSMDLLCFEFIEHYQALIAGVDCHLAPLSVQYGDYALWQRQWLTEDKLAQQLGFWQQQLADAPPLHPLPLDFSRPAVKGHQGAAVIGRLDKTLTAKVLQLAKSQQLTPFMLIHAALALVVARHGHSDDIVLGTPVANRGSSELQQMIGFFVNTLVLRVNTNQATLADFLSHVRQVNLAVQANQDVSFDHLVEQLKVPRSSAHTPIFQLLFTLVSAGGAGHSTELVLPDVHFKALEQSDTSARFDLNVTARLAKEHMSLSWIYDTQIFSQKTIETLNLHMITLLDNMCEQIVEVDKPLADVSMISEQRKRQLAQGIHGSSVPFTEQNVLAMFAEQVAKTPQQMAVRAGDLAFDYQWLEQKSNRLAQGLLELDIAPSDRVGIAITPGIAQLVAVLAVMKVAAVYVPLSPDFPPNRLNHMIEDAQIDMVLYDQSTAGTMTLAGADTFVLDDIDEQDGASWLSEFDDINPDLAIDASQSVYILYTSGSTGLPKGVMVNHLGLVNYLLHGSEVYWQGNIQSAVVSSPLYFDATLTSFLLPLVNGGAVEFLAQDDVLSALLYRLQQTEAALFKLTPAHLDGALQLLGEQVWQGDNTTEHLLVIGGEALSAATLVPWLQHLPTSRFINEYGPTETVVGCCYYEVPTRLFSNLLANNASVPIGLPIHNTQLLLLDKNGQLVDDGGIGELYIGGCGVAKGYVRLADLTAQRFVELPQYGLTGRFYKTGDWVRLNGDGQLVFCRRDDEQLNFHGYRIEAAEIEHHLTQIDWVQSAKVVVKADQLVAYVVRALPSGDFQAEALKAQLQAQLQAQLPTYMVPSVFIELDTLPLTLNGKLDVKALPAPGAMPELQMVLPQNDTEAQLLTIWSDLFGKDRASISINSDFFAIGGHSLLAVRLVSQIRQVFAQELTIKQLFEFTTIKRQAQLIASLQASTDTMLRPCVTSLDWSVETKALASFSQQRLWFVDKLQGSSVEYNMPVAVEITGPFDPQAAELAIGRIIARHESLRTVYRQQDDQVLQLVQDKVEFGLTRIDLTGLDQQAQQLQLKRLISNETQTGFDLSQDLMIRGTFIQLAELAPQQGVLLFTLHHIASDGWSMGVLLKEFAAQYPAALANKPDPLPPLSLQYRDYAYWQRQWLSAEREAAQSDYWSKQLAGVAAVHRLPLDYPRPTIVGKSTSDNTKVVKTAKRVNSQLSGDIATKLQQLALDYRLTPFMLLQGALALVLSRHSHQAGHNQEIVLGTPVANRLQQELSPLIGFFVNTLVTRIDTSKASLAQYFAKLRQTNLDAQANQDLPFEQLVELAGLKGAANHMPLFQIQFRMNTNEQQDFAIEQLQFRLLANSEINAKLDLNISAEMDASGIRFCWIYDEGLFKAERIETLARHLNTLLTALAEGPQVTTADLPMLSALEQAELLDLNGLDNTESQSQAPLSINARFSAAAERFGDKTAIRFGTESISYRMLEFKANQLAYQLQQKGVAYGQIVGLWFERSIDMVVALLAVLKTGAAYMAFDRHLPLARLQWMLGDAEPVLMLTHRQVSIEKSLVANIDCFAIDEFATIDDVADINHDNGLEALAYLAYTSGSTGQAKAVMGHHLGVGNYLDYLAQNFAIGADDHSLQLASLSFDASIRDILGPLCLGAQLHLVSEAQLKDPKALLQLLQDLNITILPSVVPSLLSTLVATASSLSDKLNTQALRLMLLSGEALSCQLCHQAQALFGAQLQMVNQYGPTECTMTSTFYRFDGEKEPSHEGYVAIGRPLNHMRALVVDDDGQLVPKGTIGQLYLTGPGVSLGYYRQKALTTARFIQDPFDRNNQYCCYQTGDLVRYREDGELVFIGRIDNQIKIRGFRVEPGEIEAQLRTHQAVDNVAVVAKVYQHQTQLVAYVVSHESNPLLSDLAQLALTYLPEHMRPHHYVVVEALPLTNNGKIDRQALGELSLEKTDNSGASLHSQTEQQVAAIWAGLLNTSVSSLASNSEFFAIGGHSLLAIMVVAEVRDTFGLELEITHVFEWSKLADLAAGIDELLAAKTNQSQPASASVIPADETVLSEGEI